jgi:transposase-like protein
MSPKTHRGILTSLVGLKQETLDNWMRKLDGLIAVKKEAIQEHAATADKIIPLLLKAKDNEISVRELAQITGLSPATMSRWMKLLNDGVSNEEGQAQV